MQQSCSYRHCYYNNPTRAAEDRQIIKFKACDYCTTAAYHSDTCKRDDWDKYHAGVCPGKKLQQFGGSGNSPHSQTQGTPLLSTARIEGNSPPGAKPTKKTLADFEKINGRELGKGSYGHVCLVKDRATGEMLAMKVMKKQFIFQHSSSENIYREIKIQKKMNHPHIVKLYHYFEDKDNVYLVLEYCKNGSLFQLLRRRGKFPEREAFIFFFQTCLGINYLHDNNFIHRDLKPENLLIDKNDNIKVCDFGWSAEMESKSRTTFCGTVDYMAPEMLKNKPYDRSLDVWCLGVLLYELLHGGPPFKGKNDSEKMNNIKKGVAISYDYSLSRESIDLISRLLKSEPSERLPMKDIFNHPWTLKFEKILQIPMSDLVDGYQRKEIALASSPSGYAGNNGIQSAQNYKPGQLLDPSLYASTRATPEQKTNRFSSYQDPQHQQRNSMNPKEHSVLDSVFGFFGCLNKD